MVWVVWVEGVGVSLMVRVFYNKVGGGGLVWVSESWYKCLVCVPYSLLLGGGCGLCGGCG